MIPWLLHIILSNGLWPWIEYSICERDERFFVGVELPREPKETVGTFDQTKNNKGENDLHLGFVSLNNRN